MEFVWSILVYMGRVLANMLTSPSFILIYLLLVGLITWQYRRLQHMSEPLLRGRRNIYFRAALVSSLLGLLGGIIGSVLLVFLGVNLSGIAVSYLWLAAVLLMLIKPRFLCFAYAAGVLSVSNLLFGYPTLNIPQLMGLVAVLHLVESLLILLNGTFNPFPVYIKKDGQLRGGFNLQLFWPIPLVALVSMGWFDIPGAIVAPDWWPLLQNYSQFTNDQAYALLPILAMLGYGEISTTQAPGQATRRSALHLSLFSLSLLLLSVLALHYPVILPVLALYSPLGHEMVIWVGMRTENRSPLYVPPEEGVMILDVLPGTLAQQQGLRSRDIILTANGESVNQYEDLQEKLQSRTGEAALKIKRGNTAIFRRVRINFQQELGIIPVPEPQAGYYLSVSEDGIFSIAAAIWRRIRKYVHILTTK
ncbi:MAG: PDZ domain-containing protein [Syntrophomonadaceae bacterium]|nr:PDZ domain-containing protein [Syntrophomonadaceae bacterium]